VRKRFEQVCQSTLESVQAKRCSPDTIMSRLRESESVSSWHLAEIDRTSNDLLLVFTQNEPLIVLQDHA